MLRMRFGKRVDERRAEQSHEAGEAHQLDVVRARSASASARS